MLTRIEIFNNLINEKGISKKQLLESMIASYAFDEIQDEREEHITFTNEINLISSNLNEVFNIFKNITIKSQDTIGSIKDFNEQKLNNLNTQLNTYKDNLANTIEKNKLLEEAKKGHDLEKEKNVNIISELKDKVAMLQNDVNHSNKKNLDLLEQINLLRSVEKENHVLKIESEKLSNELNILKIKVNEQKFENNILTKKINQQDETINEMQNNKLKEIKEIELRFKQNAELDKKSELIIIQTKYNDLQIENIKNIGIINQKSEEIFDLKSKIMGIQSSKIIEN